MSSMTSQTMLGFLPVLALRSPNFLATSSSCSVRGIAGSRLSALRMALLSFEACPKAVAVKTIARTHAMENTRVMVVFRKEMLGGEDGAALKTRHRVRRALHIQPTCSSPKEARQDPFRDPAMCFDDVACAQLPGYCHGKFDVLGESQAVQLEAVASKLLHQCADRRQSMITHALSH